ncbi:MAG TPA: hypothetical protein VFY94_11900 [Rhodanobacteraceae bacterium]|jgi:hypothetical protein|nr:hypothetical protein [Rhodanobacteraceae bacterium]
MRPVPTRGDSAPLRALTILAQDPSVRRGRRILTAKAQITAEPLMDGPCGARIKVVDYDASRDRLYLPMRGGYQKGDDWLDPFDGRSAATFLDDPRFHQQNAYAIAMRTLGYFESALGRRTCFGFKGHQLHIAPHAFAGPNAYYQRENRCLCFGYFPGPGGRMVYTCLSHDVVAHEMTHALLDGLRPRFIDPSSPDQAGFHEGFADVVALLSVLSDRAIVEQVLIRQGVMRGRRALIPPRALTASALKASALLGLAEQFGASIPNDAGTALRRSVSLKPSARWQEDPDWEEPHQRGEILVAAVMDAFLAVWVARIAGLGIVARGMYDGNRVVEEGVAAANHLMTMCIRALDYAPSTDLQYVDYLSALLTADKETVPDDSKYHYRQIVRKTFGAWGIQPVSHPGGDGCWESFGRPVSYRNLRAEALRRDPDEAFRFIWENFEALKLAREAYTQVQAVHPVARVAPDGLIVRETVVDYLQILAVRGHELGTLGLRRPEELPTGKEVRLYGGGVLVLDEFGRLKYSIGNNVANVARQQARLDYLAKVGFFEYRSDQDFSRGFFARLHLARARDRWAPGG